MATISESLAYAPEEVEQFFLLRCDEGFHEGACEWLRMEVAQELEEHLDYAMLRKRAQVVQGGREQHPVTEIEVARKQERDSAVRDCWYCGECLAVERPHCPVCGRSQDGSW
jgi:hypothetical protein